MSQIFITDLYTTVQLFIMGYLKKDISLKMLFDKHLLSSRAHTVCKQIVKGPTLLTAIKFYKSHGSFIKVRYCGLGTNAELIKLCKKPYRIVKKYNNTFQIQDNIKSRIIVRNTPIISNLPV